MMEKDRRLRLANQRRLRKLATDDRSSVTVFCAHDVREFERLSHRNHREPARSITVPAAPQVPAFA